MSFNRNQRSSSTLISLILCLSLSVYGRYVEAQPSVLTRHNDLQRTGQNLSETILNTSNVNVRNFGKLYARNLDGELYAQPLYVPGVTICNAIHNVIYLATNHNSVYAFDADTNTGSNADPLWHINFGPAVPRDVLGTEVFAIEVGIVGTPVIDPKSNTLFVAAKTFFNQNQAYSLHAIDIASGEEKPNSPVNIQANFSGTADGGDTVLFVPEKQLQRPALTLVGNSVYVSFASHEDYSPYHGWIISYDTSTLQVNGVHCNTPNGDGGGIWMSGEGLTVDSSGNIYYVNGNGDFDGVTNFGESILKLTPTLGVSDWFTPFDFNYLNSIDFDLGSSGSILLPGTHLLVAGAKNGKVYVLDTQRMGGFQPGCDNQIVQWFQASAGHIHSSMLYYESPTKGSLLYAWGENDFLKAWSFNGNYFETTPVGQSSVRVAPGYANGPGMSISADGKKLGTGILWSNLPLGDAVHQLVPGILRAYDASDITHELWNSQENANRDDVGLWAKWNPPTVVNGKVYLGTLSNQLIVYGLVAPEASLNLIATPGDHQVTLNWQSAGGADFYIVKRSDAAGGPYNILQSSLSSPGFSDANVVNGQTYYYVVSFVNSSGESGNSNEASATPSSSSNLITFVTLDTTTQGNWKGVYGGEGYSIAQDETSTPSFAQVSVNDADLYTWQDPTIERSALQKVAGNDRIASCWYASNVFNVDVNFTDGLTHQIALYSLDWDLNGRDMLLESIDPDTGLVADTRHLQSFTSGQYLVWNMKGHFLFRITNNGSSNAVLSGIFIGGGGALPPPPSPTNLTASPGDSSVVLRWQAVNGASTYNVLRSEISGGPYLSVKSGVLSSNYTDSSLTNGIKYYYVVTAANSQAESAYSNEASATPLQSSNSAIFVAIDEKTQGSWMGAFGADGYAIQGDQTSLPDYAQLNVTNANTYTWVDTTQDNRAVQRASSADRIAACWYSSDSFQLDIALTDGTTHPVTLYALDWDFNGRDMLIEAVDATSGAVLDSRSVNSFTGGKMLTWNLKGHIIFRVTNHQSSNAVLSAVFFH